MSLVMGALCLSSVRRHIVAGRHRDVGPAGLSAVSIRRPVIIMITIASINKIRAPPLIHETFSRGRKEAEVGEDRTSKE